MDKTDQLIRGSLLTCVTITVLTAIPLLCGMRGVLVVTSWASAVTGVAIAIFIGWCRIHVPVQYKSVLYDGLRSRYRLVDSGSHWIRPWEYFIGIDLPWADKIITCHRIPTGRLDYHFETPFIFTTADYMECELRVNIIYYISDALVLARYDKDILLGLKDLVGRSIRLHGGKLKGREVTLRAMNHTPLQPDSSTLGHPILFIDVTRIKFDAHDRRAMQIDYRLQDAVMIAAAGGRSRRQQEEEGTS